VPIQMKNFKVSARRKRQKPATALEQSRETPNLEQVVPRMQPEQLHQIIQSRGLEDCGEIVMLATPAQLTHIFDLDLWRSVQPGTDEQLDADRFGVWLEVLAEFGAGAAAEKVTQMAADLVIAGLAQHARVFDPAVVPPHGTIGELASDVGGYRLVAKRTDSWDAIVDILVSLDAEHPDYFHRVMRGCRALSDSTPEPNGFHDLLDAPDQAMFDLAADREQRRHEQGYVPPAQARAFLEMSRQIRLGIETAPAEPTAPPESTAPALTGIRTCLKFVFDNDHAVYGKRSEELTYIANTIMAGCSIQGRSFTAKEAGDAAVAVCNLGLENWSRQGSDAKLRTDDFLIDHDLVTVFQVGWTVLHKDVCQYAAERLLEVLAGFKSDDDDLQIGVGALIRELSIGCRIGMPWRAREALDVIASLDMPAWAALLGLIDEFPALHAALSTARNPRRLSVGASEFAFISENSHIAFIRKFMQSLPEILRP
jgi:hypothetical protein